MTIFVVFAVLLVLVALAFATLPLWRNSRRLALCLLVALPLAVAGLYYLRGNPAALQPQNLAAPKTVEEAVAQLEQRMASEPDNLEGRVLLARSYMTLEKYDLARDAYAKATALAPDDADLSVEYAESLMRASPEHRFPALAVAMLESALTKTPNNQRALFFLGMHRMQSADPTAAAQLWEKLLPLVTPDTAYELQQQINMARAAANLPLLPSLPTATVATTNALAITVNIDPALAMQATRSDILYVFARSMAGGGPPLAVQRIALDTLPMQVQLSDADSPMPTAKLSSQSTVRVMARLSKSGNAQASPGDIESEPVTVSLAKAKPISLTLSKILP